MNELIYKKLGFFKDALDMIQKVKESVIKYDTYKLGTDYVREEQSRHKHSKYADSRIMNHILLEGGKLLLQAIEKDLLDEQLKETRGNKSELRAELSEVKKPVDFMSRVFWDSDYAQEMEQHGIVKFK